MTRTHTIHASEMFDPVEVVLWDGSKFRLREATTTVEDKVTDKQKEINDLADKASKEEGEANALRREINAIIESGAGDTDRMKKLEADLEDKEEEIKEKSSTMKDMLPYLIEMLDILLEPLTPVTDEKSEPVMIQPDDGVGPAEPKMVTAEDSIQTALKANKIGISHIDALSKKLNETAMEARPT